MEERPKPEARRAAPVACPRCGADGTYRRATTVPKNPLVVLMDVRCTSCGHEWDVTTSLNP